MTDPLVIALERLVAREGGRQAVADEIGVNEQSLYQIIKRVPHSLTGKPKGVGPTIRKKLTARYPDWMSLGIDDSSGSAVASENQILIRELPPSKTSMRAPVFEWSRLGEVLFTESSSLSSGEYLETTDAASPLFKWFIVDSDMPRLRIRRGWRVAVEPVTNDAACSDGDTCLFRSASGVFFIADFRRLAGGFEAIPDSGPPLDSSRHGITVAGIICGQLKV